MFKIQVQVDKKGWLDCINMPDLETEEQAKQWLQENRADDLIALVPVVEFRVVPLEEPQS
jgi:hypothetical protein